MDGHINLIASEGIAQEMPMSLTYESSNPSDLFLFHGKHANVSFPMQPDLHQLEIHCSRSTYRTHCGNTFSLWYDTLTHWHIEMFVGFEGQISSNRTHFQLFTSVLVCLPKILMFFLVFINFQSKDPWTAIWMDCNISWTALTHWPWFCAGSGGLVCNGIWRCQQQQIFDFETCTWFSWTLNITC